MIRLSATQMRRDAADLLSRVRYGRERIILHRRGKDVAALVPLEDAALLEAMENAEDLKERLPQVHA